MVRAGGGGREKEKGARGPLQEKESAANVTDKSVAKSCTLSLVLLSHSFTAEAGFSGRVVRDNVNLGQQRWETMQRPPRPRNTTDRARAITPMQTPGDLSRGGWGKVFLRLAMCDNAIPDSL